MFSMMFQSVMDTQCGPVQMINSFTISLNWFVVGEVVTLFCGLDVTDDGGLWG